jgi:DNA invertase Pin-like site-specific DNA recombinase
MAEKRKAAIYVRVSKAREDMISPEIQVDECRRYADAKGYEVVAIEEDLHKSGRDFAKRKIDKMIQAVKDGQYSIIVVWKWSRWGRNTVTAKVNIKLLNEAGGVLESATEPIDTTGAVGKFSLTMLLAIAELESDQKSEVWRNVQANRLKYGKPGDGVPRFGYAYDGKTFRVDPETGPWLASAYRQYNGGRGLLGIATELNQNGITTSRGRPFTASSLRFTLDSGFGAGYLIRRVRNSDGKLIRDGNGDRAKPEFLKGTHEAVITEDEWRTYLARRGVKMAPRAVNPVTRVSGLAFCAACERRMKSCWQANGPRNARVTERALRCPHQPGKSTKPCDQRPIITLSLVEDRVKRWLIEQSDQAGSGDLALARKAAATTALANMDKVRELIRRQERRRAKAVELFMDEEITSKDEVKVQIAEVDAEITRLREVERSLLRDAAANELPPSDAFHALVHGWDVLDHAMVNRGLGLVIERIEISRGSKWNPDWRIRIVPKWEVQAADLPL